MNEPCTGAGENPDFLFAFGNPFLFTVLVSNFLGAPTIHHLCKSMVMVNTKFSHPEGVDVDPLMPGNRRYYLVVFQYTRRAHNEKLCRHASKDLCNGKISTKKFNFRLAPEEVSNALSGYSHNAVTPLGMRCPLHIVLSHHIAQLDHFWLGAGEVDLKWRVPVSQFLEKFKPTVADITYDEMVDAVE